MAAIFTTCVWVQSNATTLAHFPELRTQSAQAGQLGGRYLERSRRIRTLFAC